ncbi:hypothetical protein AGMMS49965_11260 [Bacteroidia bacterium]|nr:hypothetical protein AGMMS49965_11260 [Bacteroidia bacterium]
MVAVREMISSALVNTDKFNIVERSLLDKIMKEQKFSNSGAVDASQASELGKLLGANKVVVSVLSSAGPRIMLSIKMIDVQSAGIESQKVKTVKPDEIFDAVESLTLAAVGETSIPAPAAKSGGFLSGLGNAISGATGGGSSQAPASTSKPAKEPAAAPKSAKEKFAERMDEEVLISSRNEGGQNVELAFAGFTTGKNPTAEIFCDGKLVGNGTLNQGFSIKFTDEHPGAHTIKITWSGTVPEKSFNINTAAKRYYTFEYKTTGFGYALVLNN